jgi:hypothetical protein
VIERFSGLNNVRPPERLGVGELSVARDIVIDDAEQLRTRPGYAGIDSGNWHSFKNIAGRAFAVKNGVLGILETGALLFPLATVGADPLSYTSVGDTVYVSSISWSGKIDKDNVVSAWGVNNDPGRWVSPVLTPTATMGAISGRQLVAPPLASIGRIYLAVENVLWVTELYLYSQVDLHRNFIQFTHPITLLYSHRGGLLVGTTEKLYFLPGTFSQGMRLSTIMDAGAIPGSLAKIPAPKVHPQAGQQPIPESELPVLLTTLGICTVLENGDVHNLTDGRVVFSGLTRAVAIHRDEPGNSQYLVADASGQTWSLNTRTKALARFESYAFTGFGVVDGRYHGCAANGLYLLEGGDDAGTPIAARARGGLMRFGGPQLSRLKAAYITARSGAGLQLAIETGEGVRYDYAMTAREMRTMRIHMGKGMRATHFLYDITGSELDLDSLEFVPIVVQRRV